MAAYQAKGLKSIYYTDFMRVYHRNGVNPYGEKTPELNSINIDLKNKITQWEHEITLIDEINAFDLPTEKFRKRIELRTMVSVAYDILNGEEPFKKKKISNE